MTPEEQELQKAKIELQGAEKQLERYTDECGKRVAEAIAHEAAHTTLETVAHMVGSGVLKTVPILGLTLTGLDIIGKAQFVNAVYGPCYESEINFWSTKVKQADEKYKDRADRAEIGERTSIVIRQEIREKLIEKEMELKKTKGSRREVEGEYRQLYEKVHGPKMWAFDDKFSDKAVAGLKLKSRNKAIELLQKTIK